MEIGIQQLIWMNTLFFVSITVFMINYWTRGFLFTFLQAKFSRGKKKLIKVYTIVDVYFKTCTVNDGLLKYKSRSKLKKTINNVELSKAWDLLGIMCFETNEESNNIINKDFKAVESLDITKQDMYVERIMKQPTLENNDVMMKWIKITLIVVCVAIFGIILIGLQTFSIQEAIAGIDLTKGVI